MSEQKGALGPTIFTALSGTFGVIAFLMGYPVLGWIGVAGFVLGLLWLIVTAPKGGTGAGDGGSSFLFGDSSSGDGGAGSGDDGGGGG